MKKLEEYGPQRQPKQFVLCFDGTGNKFAGDTSDTNIVKIYRMLDRSQSHQYHYYQPGIGTYVTSHSLGTTGRLNRIKSSYKKAKDAALGSSFDEHVLGGYKFLMRYYDPGDDIYFFGFSRGSYTARFLAEMLDFVGLLQPGNEELIRFAWKTFAKWQKRKDFTKEDKEEKHRLFAFMKAFRETFSRPVSRIRFMGLFDTVNSVPMFENAWMERSKFPYTARTTARVIRHAVSIDERRAKFRQDLISEMKPLPHDSWNLHRLRHFRSREGHQEKAQVPVIKLDPAEETSESFETRRTPNTSNGEDEERYRTPSPSPSRRYSTEFRGKNTLSPDGISLKSTVSRRFLEIPQGQAPFEEPQDSQDIAEVWFPGQHGDIGGGWKLDPQDDWPLSHIPLAWMVKEAQLVGLEFDSAKLKRFNCFEADQAVKPVYGNTFNADSASKTDIIGPRNHSDPFQEVLTRTMDQGVVHDCLTYGGGLSFFSTLAWRLMEYLPFRRMDLQPDGSWKPISWPLPRGEVRDIPDNAQIHISAIYRLHIDNNYRPGNLIIGGGGRGVARAPEKHGIGEWEIFSHEGDILRQTYIRKKGQNFCQEEME
ncbi:uncharacterized protein N7469_000712 [Penicillium citrinum]|uniref:T6SS Phospholipase effector Tle1-like catalytic domain-containing protein n=1 Tax=Penicillium citrinum TaxID=5077 RepID=A0A9W9PDF8_PENCI|nr:uncharacterized protein N7469_000712 [Penicillium citrinum]KAJ5242385.1 hypothetical protein N7469_000712 [Penicillium citrinum]